MSLVMETAIKTAIWEVEHASPRSNGWLARKTFRFFQARALARLRSNRSLESRYSLASGILGDLR